MITRVQYNDIDNFIDTFSSLAGGKETEIYSRIILFGNEVLASFNTSLALIDLHLLHETTLRFFGIMNVAVAKYFNEVISS